MRRLSEEPYAGIVGYPKASARELSAVIRELEDAGIGGISLGGPTTLGGTQILGKGYAGVVVLAELDMKCVALKIRRTDSQRGTMRHEGEMLRRANAAGVGPALLAAGRNFIAMELIEGQRIDRWLQSLEGRGSAMLLRMTARRILEDCRRLDTAGLDHGELSFISKHVIVNQNGPAIIDFESASTNRRVSNVTSAAQAMFVGGMSGKVQRICRIPPKERVIGALRKYKQSGTHESFASLLAVLRL